MLVVVSDRTSDDDGVGIRRHHHHRGGDGGAATVKANHRVTSVAVLESPDGSVKLFTGS